MPFGHGRPKGYVLAAFLSIILLTCSSPPSEPEAPQDEISYVIPEAVGFSSQEVEIAKAFAQQCGYAAVMAAYDGKVFLSWGEVSRNFWTHSIRKSLLSALYGIHVGRGEIDLDETLAQLGIDDIPPSLTDQEKLATVRELIQSRSGVYHPAAAEDPVMDSTRPGRGSHPHGTYYYYNNWDFNVAGVVFRQKTGLDIFQAFKSEIGDAIGMQDFNTSLCAYQYEYNKSEHPAYPFRMSARDLLRFGVLFQKGGLWLGHQIIPSSWIDECTTSYSIMDSTYQVGYGYMWMTVPQGTPAESLFGHSGYFHTGAGVHLLTVMPEARLVVVFRLNTDGQWIDPGDAAQMQLMAMIVNARL